MMKNDGRRRRGGNHWEGGILKGGKPVLEKDVEHQPNEVDHGVLGAHCIAAAAAAARPIWRALSLEGGIAVGGV